jgi:Skp family chaperone for outer membrane proteins
LSIFPLLVAVLFQHVNKQLETLRTMTESRNRVYEEVDRISQDLERQNQKLAMDAKADRQKIDRYVEKRPLTMVVGSIVGGIEAATSGDDND